MDDTKRGLYGKYHVERLADFEGKHDACKYFVLDPKHDKFAKVALAAYAEACATEYPALALDLRAWLHGDHSPLRKIRRTDSPRAPR